MGNLNEIISSLDHNAAITDISPNIKNLAGFEYYELIGRPFIDFLHPEDVINFHAILEPDVNFIQKPFTINDLAAKIHEVLSQ